MMDAKVDLLREHERVPRQVIGEVGVLKTWFRLTGVEFYKIYRGTMAKVLLGIGLAINIIVLLAIGISTWSYVNRPATEFTPPICSESANTPGCLNHLPTLADRQLYKQQEIANNAQILSLPGSLQLVFLVSVNILVVLVILLAGTNVGNEYTFGTIRLLYTRGPSRLQFLWAKIGAIGACAALGILLFASLTIVLGDALHPLSQLAIDRSFFNIQWLARAGLYLLACLLYWLVYAIIALFFATLGRSNVAGIVGALIWLFAEEILTRLLFTLAKTASGPLSAILSVIPTYFVGNAAANLILNQGVFVFHGQNGLVSSLHAGLVVGTSLLTFISISSWLIVRRDVQN